MKKQELLTKYSSKILELDVSFFSSNINHIYSFIYE